MPLLMRGGVAAARAHSDCGEPGFGESGFGSDPGSADPDSPDTGVLG